MTDHTGNLAASPAVHAAACPGDDALLAFCSGSLADGDLATIADHISQCETCEVILHGLVSADDSLSSRLREAVQRPVPIDEPACLRMQEAAKALARGRQDSVTAETELDFESRASELEKRPAVDERSDVALTRLWMTPLPATIGGYQIKSELGQGGFGTVYLAHDPDLDRLVAIKVPKFADGVSAERREWFVQEARMAAKLKHPGIISVYEVGKTDDGSCFIVMEYVEGTSLAAEMAAGKISRQRAVQIVSQAAAAVHYAHKKGLIHRDLKPGNILLDDEGQVKIADFGLAVHENQQRGRAGERAGTLAYMSPEQVRGDVHRLDGRSDIWSLGVILYELLTGRRPFAGTPREIVDEVLNRLPKPPRQIDDTIPAELEAICLKCLAKEADGRYSSAADLGEGLAHLGRRRPRPLALLGAVGAGAAAVLAGVLWIASFAWTAAPKTISQSVVPATAPAERPTTPLMVDAVAEQFVWYPLLTRQPWEPFSGLTDNESFHFNAKRQEVLLNSPDVTILSLGQTEAPMYTLQIEMLKTAPAGDCGIFLGMHEAEPDGRHRRVMAHCVWLKCRSRERFTMERELLEITVLRDGIFGVSTTTLSVTDVTPTLQTQGLLEVSVAGNKLRQVRWMSEPLGELTGNVSDARAHTLSCTGQFGILNRFGTTTFRDGKFKLLMRNEP